MRDSHILMFDAFRVDLLDERLWRGEEMIHLTNKAFTVLRYLLDHPAQLVPKEALLQAGWPDTYVSDAVLTVCVRELRWALGVGRPGAHAAIYRNGAGTRISVPRAGYGCRATSCNAADQYPTISNPTLGASQPSSFYSQSVPHGWP